MAHKGNALTAGERRAKESVGRKLLDARKKGRLGSVLREWERQALQDGLVMNGAAPHRRRRRR
jgi:hypothetical protein